MKIEFTDDRVVLDGEHDEDIGFTMGVVGNFAGFLKDVYHMKGTAINNFISGFVEPMPVSKQLSKLVQSLKEAGE